MTENEMKGIARKMNMQAIVFRGHIINAFVIMEGMMDNIIVKNLGNDPDYSDDMNMRTRKKLFTKFIEMYEANTGKKLDGLMDKINYSIDKRNHLAHWVFDTTPEGVKAFKKSKVMKFVWVVNDVIKDKEILTEKAVLAAEKRILAAAKEVNAIFQEMYGQSVG